MYRVLIPIAVAVGCDVWCSRKFNGSKEPSGSKLLKERIKHIRQEENWDCGRASTLMAMSAGIEKYAPIDAHFKGVNSIWTVEIALALHHIGLPVVYFTNINADSNDARFEGMPFYNDYKVDKVRISQCFRTAHSSDLTIVEKSLSKEEFRKLFVDAKLGPIFQCVILLVDANRLTRPYLALDMDRISVLYLLRRYYRLAVETFENLTKWVKRPSYNGHYIVVIDFDSATNLYQYRNPSSMFKSSFVDADVLHIARTASGTDEDMIFVELGLKK